MTLEQMIKNNEGAVKDYEKAIYFARRAGLETKAQLLEKDLMYYKKCLNACLKKQKAMH